MYIHQSNIKRKLQVKHNFPFAATAHLEDLYRNQAQCCNRRFLSYQMTTVLYKISVVWKIQESTRAFREMDAVPKGLKSNWIIDLYEVRVLENANSTREISTHLTSLVITEMRIYPALATRRQNVQNVGSYWYHEYYLQEYGKVNNNREVKQKGITGLDRV